MTKLTRQRRKEACLLKVITSAEDDWIRFGTRSAGLRLDRLQRRLDLLRREMEVPPVEYEVHGGVPYLVLFRLTDRGPTGTCPFCGCQHWHGQGDGHAAAHCQFTGVVVTAADGTELTNDRGYIVRTRGDGQ